MTFPLSDVLLLGFLMASAAASVFVLVALVFLLAAMLRGAPFVPTKPGIVKQMVALAEVRPGERAADLGSGDGRLVIALAQAGAEAHGYEINPLLVWWARRKIQRAGLKGRAFVHWKSFWQEQFGSFDVITVFGITHIMPKLEQKLKQELKPHARIVSHAFAFPSWPHSRRLGSLYCYEHEQGARRVF